MAGERYAKITIQAALSHEDSVRGAQAQQVTFVVDGQTILLQRGGATSQYIVPDPDDAGVGDQYVMQCVQNVLALLKSRLYFLSLPYTISAPRVAGTKPDSYDTTAMPCVEFDLTATAYGAGHTLDFKDNYASFPGWVVTQRATNITPVTATAVATPATYFGASDGAITVQPAGGDYNSFIYDWADGVSSNQPTRTGLKAGSYTCVVRDLYSQASMSITVVVTSDAEFVVGVTNTADSITLTPTGGVAPYTYAWDDGPTTAARTGLAVGTYAATVREQRGLSRRITVTLSAYHYYWSENPIPLALDAGAAYRADPTTKPNLSFLCEVWVEPDYLSGKFTQVGTTLEQPADAQGRTVFQVQALLAVFLSYHVPAPGATDVERADPLFRRFYLRHAEQYGAVPTPKSSISLERNYVVLGGLSFYEASQATWFSDYQPTKRPFLSWEPTTKPALDDQPEFLYFMAQAAGDFRVQVRTRFRDGTEQFDTYPGQDTVRPFEVYCLPVGYQALSLASLSQPVAWWEVFVTTPDRLTVLSETRRFVRDTERYPKRRYFLFATSLGGMATYAALGEAQLDAEVTGEELGLSLAPGYDPQLGDTAVLSRALRPVLKVAAGKRTQAQLLASQDFLLSRRVLLLAGARWVPGFVKAKTANVLDENKLVPTQEFEFYQATERLYTPAL